MRGAYWTCLAAAGLIGIAGAAGAQSTPPQSAEQNVRESQQYEQLLCTNPSFRAKRIVQECGPITDPQLRQSCEASFQCNAPSEAPHWRRTPLSEKIH